MNLLAVAIIGLTLLQPENHGPVALQRFEFEEAGMGTTFRFILYASDAQSAETAAKEAFARVTELNGILSDYDPQSEVRRLCDRSPQEGAVVVSEDLWRVLTRSLEVSAATGGAFDVTVGPVVRLWRRARRLKILPPRDRLQEALDRVGWEKITMDPATRSVLLGKPEMRLDFGGIAKGFTADECLKILKAHGMERALVDCGGDITVGAAPPGQEGWRIGVAGLDRSAPPDLYLILTNASVATSGDAYQFVVLDGQRYSHIVNPFTGLGLTQRSNVTVVAPDGATADAWATALSVLEPTEGLAKLGTVPGAAARICRLSESGTMETYESPSWHTLRSEPGGSRP